jgi:hypothetical protein
MNAYPPPGGPPGQPGMNAYPPPGATRIQLTETEAAAVENLASLGFDPREALEAYLGCDKNEMQAANLLFENYVPLSSQEV